MLEVFDLLCNGLRDPKNVAGNVRLSWRLASDRKGARQVAYRVVVVSLLFGDVLWDTGTVASDDNAVTYGGATQPDGQACTWFVVVTDDAGDQAQSIPAAFVWGNGSEPQQSELPPQRLGFVWCSDEVSNRAWEHRDACDLSDPMWRDVLGVKAGGLSAQSIVVEPDLAADYSFVQGSLLLTRGLLIVRWEKCHDCAHITISLPPGVRGELVASELHRKITSGCHIVEVPL